MTSSFEKKTTDFGFTEVPIQEKARHVAHVFHSVAKKYDLMNDVMSLGLHRLWKKFTISESGVRENHKVLDIAGGTGDLTLLFSKKVGASGSVVLADINESMLKEGRARLLDQGIAGNVFYVQADAETLPFPDHYFDCVSIAFGLRNVTDKQKALESMYRVLKPGGKLLILEFSKPLFFQSIYDAYSFHVIPQFGKYILNDEKSYQYLVESIRKHPDQETLKKMVIDAGFEDVDYHNLTGGIVALHTGWKY